MKLAGEKLPLGDLLGVGPLVMPQKQDIAQEMEMGTVERGIAAACIADGGVDIFAVIIVDAATGDVGAINREAGDDFTEDAAQAVEREVA